MAYRNPLCELGSGKGNTVLLLPTIKYLTQMITLKIARISSEAQNIDFVSTLYAYIYKPNTCFYCNNALNSHNRSKDHLIPKMLSYSGMNTEFKTHLGNINLVRCCKSCNNIKGCMSLYQFREYVSAHRLANYKTIICNINKVLHIPFRDKLLWALGQLF